MANNKEPKKIDNSVDVLIKKASQKEVCPPPRK